MSALKSGGRLRAYMEFLAAILYYFLFRSLAHQSAMLWVRGSWEPLAEQGILLVLLLAGYTFMGRFISRESNPVAAQGLPLRAGWLHEARLGIALGWGMVLACVLPLTLWGGIGVVLNLQARAWMWWAVYLLFFAVAALAEEVAFRGYGFQRLERVLGGFGAMLVFATFYAVMESVRPHANMVSISVAALFAVVLSTTYLRSRALWMSWGINFAWKAVRALVFGLVVAGVGSYSPVVQGIPMGPRWLTGGGFGLEASWLALIVMLAAIPVVFRLTRDLDFEHNAPVIEPGGIPVDLDAAARQQHEVAMGPVAAPPQLVQIAGATAAVSPAEGPGRPDPGDAGAGSA